MPSAKMSYCYMFFILLVTLSFVVSEETSSSSAGIPVAKGNCSCGGFASPEPAAGAAPLLSQAPGLVVDCDPKGGAICRSLCTALATATKAKGPEILCNRLRTADELKLSAFFKVCDMPWEAAGMTAEEPLCCEESKVRVCASAAAAAAAQGPADKNNTSPDNKTL